MTQNRGRRVALPPPERVARGLRARLNITAVLAVLLPALTVGALSLVQHPDATVEEHPPSESSLDLATLACPRAITKTKQLLVASAGGADGSVDISSVSANGSTDSVDVPSDDLAAASPGRGPATVRGLDDMAPALSAARVDDGPAVAPCVTPRPQQWFTGLGAGARHSTVLELVNPDPGPAIADISLTGARGPIDAPSLRGITVPGGRSLRLDLAQETPLRGELSAHVVVSRGRLGVFAVDTVDELGRGDAGVDWLAPQEPATDLLLLGLPSGAGSRSVVLANDGDDEVRAVVRVVTGDSSFRPQGLEDVRVPPHAVTHVPMGSILGKAVRDGAVGVQIEATQPVTATLRSFVSGDLSHAVPLTTFGEETQAILPRGRSTVVLNARSVTSAEIVAFKRGGGQKVTAVDLSPGRTTSVRLPREAVLVRVTPSSSDVRGAVVTVRGGAAVTGLRDLVRTGLVPDLRPALP